MKIERICVGPMEVNCYVISDCQTKQAIIIDPGADYQQIKKVLDNQGLSPAFIINTHGHIDHIQADDRFSVPIYIHRDDIALLKDPKLNLSAFFDSDFILDSQIKPLEDNQDIDLGEKIRLKVIHTPGHTPGSICLQSKDSNKNILFSGDTLFCEGVGRTDFPGASSQLLIKSIKERILVLADDTVIYPGHGPISSIGHEKKTNLFLMST